MNRENNKYKFLKYCLVGISNALSSYVVYLIFCNFLGVNVYISYFIGFTVGVLVAFVLQRKYVFSKKGENSSGLVIFIKVYSTYFFTSCVLAELLLFIWIDVIDISRLLIWCVDLLKKASIDMSARTLANMLAPFLNMVITVPIGYFLNKNWAYKDSE